MRPVWVGNEFIEKEREASIPGLSCYWLSFISLKNHPTTCSFLSATSSAGTLGVRIFACCKIQSCQRHITELIRRKKWPYESDSIIKRETKRDSGKNF